MFQPNSQQKHPVSSDLLAGKKVFNFLLLCFLLSFVFSSFTVAISTPDSLLLQLEQDLPATQRADIMVKLAREYTYSDLSKTIEYANKAYNLYMSEEDFAGMARSLTILGGGYFSQGDYAAAESWLNEALSLSRKVNDKLQTGKILNNLAGVKMNTGKLNEAIDHFLEAAACFKTTNYKDGAIAVENSISVLYQKTGSYQKAHEHLQYAIELAEEQENYRLLGSLYYNLGNLLSEEERYEEALDAAKTSYNLRLNSGHQTGQVKSLMILGSIHFELEQYQASDTCYKRALILAETYQLSEDQAYILMHYGYQSLVRNKFETASDYFSKSLSLAGELNDPALQMQLHDYLFQADSARGDFRQALKHLQQYNNLKYSWENNEALERLDELEGLFALAKYENAEKDKIISRNKTLITCLWAGLVLLILLSVLIVQQVLLRSQRKIAELSQENLRSQMNPHFIFNILNSIHSYLLKNDTHASGNYLKLFSGFLRRTLDNADSKLSTVHDELEALKSYLELESLRFDNRLEYSIEVDEEIDPLMFRIPTFLLQPYVENSIVHGLQSREGKGKIEVKLEYQRKSIHCSITDNGIGRKKAEELKLGRTEKHKSRGTAISESRMKLLNKIYGKRFSVNYSDVLDENQHCQGTKVEFNLPVLN